MEITERKEAVKKLAAEIIPGGVVWHIYERDLEQFFALSPELFMRLSDETANKRLIFRFSDIDDLELAKVQIEGALKVWKLWES